MEESSSYADKLIEKDVWMIVLVRGENDEGKNIFHYIAVKGEDLEKFLDVQQSGEYFNPEDYGVIIDSGEGEPSTATKTRLVRSFNLTQVT